MRTAFIEAWEKQVRTRSLARIIACYGVIGLIALGCATAATRHENFVHFLDYQVGKKWTWLRDNHQFRPEEALIGSRELPNGNVEKTYKDVWKNFLTRTEHTCILVYEIDPKTDIIVRADFRGMKDAKKDCIMGG